MGTPLWLEYAKPALQALTCLVAGMGFYYARRQLGLAVAAYRDLHD
jgi:hypothetical protein